MTRRYLVPATALLLSCIMATTGSVSRDATAGIVVLSQSAGAPLIREEGPGKLGPGPDFAPDPPRNVSVRYWIRGIVLLLIILLVLWLIYRTFTGWKPMIS